MEGLWGAGMVSERAGWASDPVGRALEPAGRTSEPTGRPGGGRREKDEKKK